MPIKGSKIILSYGLTFYETNTPGLFALVLLTEDGTPHAGVQLTLDNLRDMAERCKGMIKYASDPRNHLSSSAQHGIPTALIEPQNATNAREAVDLFAWMPDKTAS